MTIESNQIEFHDAKIECLNIFREGNVEIVFGHICIYDINTKLPDMTRLWSMKAKLLLCGVEHIEVLGQICADDYVAIGQLIDFNGAIFTVVDTATTCNSRACVFLLAGSGTSIKARFRMASWCEMTRLGQID